MNVVLRPPIVFSFAPRRGPPSAFFLLAAGRASLFSSYVFAAYCYPLGRFRWLQVPLLAVANVLYIPIYILGLVIPFLRSPFASSDDLAAFDFQGFLSAHLRAGVLAYLVVF